MNPGGKLLDGILQEIRQIPSLRPLALLGELTGYALFQKRGREFVLLEKEGVSAPSDLTILESRPSLIREAIEKGSARISLETSSQEFWVVVDRTHDPEYLLALHLPPGQDAGPILRLLLNMDAARSSLEEDLPVWLEDGLTDALRLAPPLLLVAETGSGQNEFVRAYLRGKFGSAQAGAFFSPGRLSQPVQLREMFGDSAGVRLGGSGSVTPLVDRPEKAIVIHEAADLCEQAQLRLLAHFTEGSTRQAWIFVTSRDLKKMSQAGKFIPGLFRILSPSTFVLPPVRTCRDRIPEEVARLMNKLRARHGREIDISDRALASLSEMDWPGNWLQLKNSLESAFLLCAGSTIEPEDLKKGSAGFEEADDLNLRRRAMHLERELIQKAYALHGGNQVQMARALGISRGSLQYKLGKYGIE